MSDTAGERAKIVRREAAKTQAEMADILGISLGTWQKIERNEGLPSGETLMKFQKLGVNPGWLLTGLGPKTSGGDVQKSDHSARAKVPGNMLSDEEFVRVPVFDVKASAGHGRLAVSQMPVGEVAFAVDFLRRLGANPQSCYLLEARGDSMWPTVPDGAMLIADASQTEVDDGRIYHFDVNERVLVKRARWKLGRLYLTSDNVAAGYPDESFAADRVDDIIVRGRIVFVGHAPLPMR